MSSFLDKFNKDNYQDFLDEEKKDIKSERLDSNNQKSDKQYKTDNDHQQGENTNKYIDQPEIESNVEDSELIQIEPYSEESKAVFRKQEPKINLQATRGSEEEVEIDTTYKKRKRKQRIILLAISASVVITFALAWFFVNRVKVPEFIGKTYAEVTKWAQQNNMTLDVSNSFSLEYDENIVMEQGQDANTALMKGSTFSIKISNGADPEELVKLPDFTGKKQAEVDKWILVNKMKNITVVQEFSTDIPSGEFIKLTIKDSKVSDEMFKRKDYAIISISKGEEVFEKNIEVIDFKDKSKNEVEEWAKKNEVVINFVEQASNTVMEGQVISQSVAQGEKVAKHDTIEVVISLGKAVVIPNYYNYTFETAGNADSNIHIDVREVYSDSVAYGYLISQSHAPGAVYSTKDDITVKVVYSLGLPYIDSLIGDSEKNLPSIFFDFQSKGANITYQTVYVSSACSRGTIVDASKHGQFTGLSDHIVIYVSNGSGSSCAVNP